MNEQVQVKINYFLFDGTVESANHIKDYLDSMNKPYQWFAHESVMGGYSLIGFRMYGYQDFRIRYGEYLVAHADYLNVMSKDEITNTLNLLRGV